MRSNSKNNLVDLLFAFGVANGIGAVALTFFSAIMAIVDFHSWSLSSIYADFYLYFNKYFPYSIIIASISFVVLLIIRFFSSKKHQ